VYPGNTYYIYPGIRHDYYFHDWHRPYGGHEYGRDHWFGGHQDSGNVGNGGNQNSGNNGLGVLSVHLSKCIFFGYILCPTNDTSFPIVVILSNRLEKFYQYHPHTFNPTLIQFV